MPTDKEIACWQQVEHLIRQTLTKKGIRFHDKEDWIEIDPKTIDQLNQLLLELDYERHVR